MTPDRLTLNLVLPGEGTATVTDVRLVDFGAAASQPASAPATVVIPPTLDPTSGRPSWLGVAAGALAGLAAAVALIAAAVILSIRGRMRRTSTAAELRRMQAIDAL